MVLLSLQKQIKQYLNGNVLPLVYAMNPVKITTECI